MLYFGPKVPIWRLKELHDVIKHITPIHWSEVMPGGFIASSQHLVKLPHQQYVSWVRLFENFIKRFNSRRLTVEIFRVVISAHLWSSLLKCDKVWSFFSRRHFYKWWKFEKFSNTTRFDRTTFAWKLHKYRWNFIGKLISLEKAFLLQWNRFNGQISAVVIKKIYWKSRLFVEYASINWPRNLDLVSKIFEVSVLIQWIKSSKWW